MVTMSDDLIEFLRARLNEDERDADGIHRYEGGMSPLTCDHIVAAGHDACTCNVRIKLRADIEAKRHLLEQADLRGRAIRTATLDGGFFDHILRVLALPYADHPDYRSEWRP